MALSLKCGGALLYVAEHSTAVISIPHVHEKSPALGAELLIDAERKGFEPLIPFDRYTHFPGVPLQPLEHLSVTLF